MARLAQTGFSHPRESKNVTSVTRQHLYLLVAQTQKGATKGPFK